jgi:uncharacterized protein YndB with AHSA1/START domain
MKWLLIAIGVVAAVVVILWAAGAAMPREHKASRAVRLKQPPEAVWAAISDVDGLASWRKELKSVRRLADVNGLPAWVEVSNMGEMPLRVEQSEAPRRMVTRITDESLPFGGTWTFEIAPAEGGATLRITEDGIVKPPIFRVLSRFVFGHAASIETYLTNLGVKFGEQVQPQP